MQMTTNYVPGTAILTVRYDDKAQSLFRDTARILSRWFTRDGSNPDWQDDLDWYEDIGRNVLLLTHLGTKPSGSLRVRPEHLVNLLNLLSLLTHHLIAKGQVMDSWRDLLMLLAKATPSPVLPVDLPPAEEVFDRKTQEDAYRSFESLRLWKGGAFPEISVLSGFQLLVALGQLRKPTEQIKILMTSLENGTLCFRWAMEDLGLNEISRGARRKGRK